MIRRALAAAAVAIGVLAAPTTHAAPSGVGTSNVAHVANISWGKATGTDMEFATIDGRDYAFAGTYQSGLKVVDITDPRHPERVASYSCGIAQGDVQIFRRGPRTYATYTADDGYSAVTTSACFRDAGVEPPNRYGTFIIDVTKPSAPVAVSFVPIARGSHNTTVHPSGMYLYNSNADLENPSGVVEIVDISDLERPSVTKVLDLVTGLSSHDITFSKDGKRAYVAALTHTLILDTTNPADPRILGRIIDPTVNIHHGAEPFTIKDTPLGPRTYVIVSDELAGAAGNLVCPGGGLHVYDATGPLEAAPIKVGFYAVPDIRITEGDSITCTAHVMQVHEQAQLMTIAWYASGVHVLDLSGLGGAVASVGAGESIGAGISDLGSYRFPNSDTWSAKTNRIAKDGSFYLYGNDTIRGFDVYRYTPNRDGKALASGDGTGTWLTPDLVPAVQRLASYRPFCLLPQG